MYDVMIIDDDQSVLDRLKSIIQWDETGIRLVCEAQDSETARELFLLNRPKIIITDIHIPIISGLELAQEISAIDPEVRFIVVTGYNDFEYVKSSVKLGAIDLISKPVMPGDIKSSLVKAVEFFDKLKEEQISSQKMKLLLEESLPTYCEKFVSSILNQTRNYTENEIIEKLEALHLDILGQYYTIVLISPAIDALSAADTDLILVAVKNMSDQVFSDAGYKIYSLYDNNYRLNCLLSWASDNGNELLEETIQNIYEKISFYWEVKILAGIGRPVTNITGLPFAMNEAAIALNYQGVLENGPVINYKNAVNLEAPVINDEDKIVAQAVQLFRKNDLQNMSKLIRNEILGILSSTNDSLQQVKKLVFEFISSIIVESLSLGINIEIISKYSDMFGKIFSSRDVQSLLQYMLDFTKNISIELSQKHSDYKNHLIDMAKSYIQNNLGNEKLSLDMVSKNIGFSSIYFCRLFHKEEGISFSNYLNINRVNKAKELLLETSLKVFEVGYAVGYGNPKYFNYIFKKIAGITPLEYRNAVY